MLATTSKEGRTTAIVLSCLSKIEEFGADVLGALGLRIGKRTRITCFTEVVFVEGEEKKADRPDGLIVVETGRKVWTALVEAKVGSADLEADQIERYRSLAKTNSVDAVLTISNQFATNPSLHPLEAVRRSRSKVPVYHLSWMSVLTSASLLMTNDAIADQDQVGLTNELVRFLSHESAGIKGFERMPAEWAEINRLVSAGGQITAKSPQAETVIYAWHQETRDLTLILSRQTEAIVTEWVPLKHRKDAGQRQRDELARLCEENSLYSILSIPDAAAPLEICADLARRTFDVGMTLRAPSDRVSSKARVNWLLRQLKGCEVTDLHVRLTWPGSSPDTQFTVAALLEDSAIVEQDKKGLQVVSFHVYAAKRTGARFIQQANFIKDVEEIVPKFYREVGQNLAAWVAPAPRVKKGKETAEDVSVTEIADDADGQI